MKKFYHGTFDYKEDEILKVGYIDNFSNPEDTTVLLNTLLNGYAGTEVRDNCVFLTDEENLGFSYDIAFIINEDSLNSNYLYVADFDITNKILSAYNNKNKKLLNYYIRKYLRSIVPYEKFLKIEKEYRKYHKDIEFLYFNKINIQ